MQTDQNHVALVAARTERTWEAQCILTAADLTGQPVRVKFPFACEVLGIYPSIVQASNVGGGRRVATLDEVVVSMKLNTETAFTSQFVEMDTASQAEEVTLGAFRDTMGGARTMLIDVSAASSGVDQNEIVCKFKWKVPAVAAALFEDCAVGVAFLVRRKAR